MCSLEISTYVFATQSAQSNVALRNSIAKQWTYVERGQYEQNCLSFALENGVHWTWPWGNRNPSRGEAKSFLYSEGYRNQADAGNLVSFPGNKEIYAYYIEGKNVTHFSRAYGSPQNTRAKWGHYEVFGHNTHNPYTDYAYGHMTFKANKSG